MREDWGEILYKDAVYKVSTTKHKLKQKEYLQNGLYPVVDQGQNIIGGYTDDKEKLLNCRLPVIVFGDHTKKIKLINFQFAPGADGTKVLEPKNGICPKFISLLTEILVFKIKDKGYARHYQHIEKQYLPLPSVAEQRAIVSKIENLFASLDKGIADLRTAQEQLYFYKQAVLAKAFKGEFTKKEDITWGKLIDVIDSVEYGTSSKSLENGLVPVLRMGNIQDGRIDWSDLKYSSDKEEIEKYNMKKYDVLFNRTNSPEHVGKTAIYLGEKDALFAGYLIRINYKKDEVNPFYLNYYLNSLIAKQHGNKVKSFGVNQSNINGTKLKQYPFPKASIDIQSKIVFEIETRLTVYDKIEEGISQALEKTEALRQSILKKAFEGNLLSEAEIEKCKQKTDYEPASVLLEKIKKEKIRY